MECNIVFCLLFLEDNEELLNNYMLNNYHTKMAIIASDSLPTAGATLNPLWATSVDRNFLFCAHMKTSTFTA